MTQAATIAPPADLATPEVDLDLVHIVDGYNPRKLTDKQGLARLSESIKEIGMLEPLVVVCVDDHFELVAGERRHKAAHEAGLKKIPIILREDRERELMTAVENTQQEELDVVAKGTSWKMVARARGLTTNAQIAEAVFENVDTVGAHMRILRLPEGVQRCFAEGLVNLDAERPLREVARISPRIAECVCEVAKRRKVKASRFLDCFDDLLRSVPETKFDDPPVMIPTYGATLEKVVLNGEHRDALVARLADLWSDQTVTADGVRVDFSPQEIGEARAFGALVEWKRKDYVFNPARFICDAEFAADLADRWVDDLVKRAEKDRKTREKNAQAAKAARDGVDPSASEVEQRKKAEAKRKREATKARKERMAKLGFNEEVGRKMTRRRGKRVEQRAAARFDLLAALLLDSYPDFGTSLRLVLSQLQERDGDEIKFATSGQSTEYLRDRLARADTVEEKVEVMIEAIAVDQVADNAVLPPSESWQGRYFVLDEKAEKALASEVKALTPITEEKN